MSSEVCFGCSIKGLLFLQFLCILSYYVKVICFINSSILGLTHVTFGICYVKAVPPSVLFEWQGTEHGSHAGAE